MFLGRGSAVLDHWILNRSVGALEEKTAKITQVAALSLFTPTSLDAVLVIANGKCDADL